MVAILGTAATIGEISEIAASIAATVEQQSAATQEISRNVQEAAKGICLGQVVPAHAGSNGRFVLEDLQRKDNREFVSAGCRRTATMCRRPWSRLFVVFSITPSTLCLTPHRKANLKVSTLAEPDDQNQAPMVGRLPRTRTSCNGRRDDPLRERSGRSSNSRSRKRRRRCSLLVLSPFRGTLSPGLTTLGSRLN